MRGCVLGVLAVLALAGPAWGEDAAPPMASESKLAGFKFPIPAAPLDDDGTYRATLNGVAAQAKLQCGALEAFGWTYEGADKGQPLVDSTVKAMTGAGYTIKALKPPEKSQAFPGLATGKKKKTVVLIWAADPAAATLVMCEGQPVKK
jgi:hypothetical protein